MAVKEINVTTTGAAGSATGNTTAVINGKINRLAINYHASAPNTTDITIADTATTPNVTFYTKANSNTDATVYPAVALQDSAGTAVTYDGTNEIYVQPIVHSINVTLAQCDALTNAVTVTVFYEPMA